jgi:hypothetical protein
MMLEYIKSDEELLAIVMRFEYSYDGTKFFTPNSSALQLGFMKRPKNYQVISHFHNPISRTLLFTQEFLIVKSGLIQLKIFNNSKKIISTLKLNAGDMVLLFSGGHGLEMLEDSEIIEVKNGPYLGEIDKTRFKD